MKSPVKYFAEEILYPILASMNDNVDVEKEKEMVMHLKKEFIRLKKVSKTTSKQNKKERFVNSDCKHQNSIDISKTFFLQFALNEEDIFASILFIYLSCLNRGREPNYLSHS